MSGSRLILMSRSTPLHHMGGMEAVVWDLARELAKSIETVVVTTTVPSAAESFAADGVQVVTVPGTPPGRYSRQWWSGSRHTMERELGSHVTGVLSVSAAAYGCIDMIRSSCDRLVLQAHGTSPMEIASKLGTRRPRQMLGALRNLRGLAIDTRRYRAFDAVVAVGPAVRDSLLRPPLGKFVSMPPVTLLGNGVDTDVFKPLEDPTGARGQWGFSGQERILLVAGRLHAQKSVTRALDALVHLGPEYRLAIAGTGPDEKNLRRRAHDLSLENRVVFLGSVDRPELARLYAAADLSLLTSTRREGLPMAVLESLAAHTPVVVPLGGAADLGYPGIVATDVADPRRLAVAVTSAVTVRPPVSLPAEHALGRVAERYAQLLGVDHA